MFLPLRFLVGNQIRQIPRYSWLNWLNIETNIELYLYQDQSPMTPSLPRKESFMEKMGSLKRFMGSRPLPSTPDNKAPTGQ